MNCTKTSISPPSIVIHFRRTPASNLPSDISPLPNSAKALRESSAVPIATTPAPKAAARASRQPRTRKITPASIPAASCQSTIRRARRRPEARLLSKCSPRAVCTKRHRYSSGHDANLEKYISRPAESTTARSASARDISRNFTLRRSKFHLCFSLIGAVAQVNADQLLLFERSF